MARKRLGEILIEAGLIDEATLRVGLTEQRRFGGPLGRVLVDMKKVTEEDLVGALSRQLAVPLIDLDRLEIPQHVIELVPGEMAETYSLIPFAQPMKFLDVALGDPTNQTVIDELRVRTQLNIRTYLAGPKAVERALLRYYGRGLGTTIGGRRVRVNVDLDPAGESEDDMEIVSGYSLDGPSRTTQGTRIPRGATGSSPEVARLLAPPAPGSSSSPPVTVAAEPAPAPAQAQPMMSSPAITPPPMAPVVPRTTTLPPVARVEAPPVPATLVGRAPTMAEVAALHERIGNLEALVRRDEDVLKKLMALLIEKGVATRDELIAKLR